MMERSRTRFGALLLCALVIGACDDGSGPDLDGRLDPSGAESTLTSVVETLGAPAEAFSAVETAAPAISSTSAALAPSGGGLMPSMSRVRTLPSEPSAAIFPSNYLGRTFVWDTQNDEYVVDQGLTGAPANGVRLIYYGIDPVTDRPIEPLVELGRVDLTDEGSASSWRLGIEVVNTAGDAPITHVDYFIDASWTDDGNTSTVRVQAEGFVSDGERQLDIDLDRTLSYTQSSSTFGVLMDDALSFAGEDASVQFVADGSLSLDTEQPATLDVTMTIAGEGETAVLDAHIVAEDLSGTVTFPSSVIEIGGTTAQPVFTKSDGSPLDAADVQALRAIWEALEDFMAFTDRVFSPFDATTD
ncbi:MAG: hypothetical protein ACRELV_00620 [Longimicrobiales bacterium]